MVNFLSIEVIEKESDQPDEYFLDALEQNFRSRYSVDVEKIFENEKEKRKLTFLNITEVENRIVNALGFYDFFLNNYFIDKEYDKFQYWQRILAEREKEQITERKNFLVVKYTTNLIPKMREYYQFINKFIALFDILYYIEEVVDGFILFFERESDFNDYLVNIISVKDLEQFSQDKQLNYPPGVYEKLANLVMETLVPVNENQHENQEEESSSIDDSSNE
jgi:hypothetical protein